MDVTETLHVVMIVLPCDLLFSHHTHPYHRPSSQAIFPPSPALEPRATTDSPPLSQPSSPAELASCPVSPPLETSSTPHDPHGRASLSPDSHLVEEVPAEVENQVLDSGVLLSSLDREEDLSPSDVEGDLPTCPLEDQEGEEGCVSDSEETEESLNLDGYIATQLEELMSKLSEASSAQYKLSSSNRVMLDSPELPEAMYPQEVMYEDLVHCNGREPAPVLNQWQH